MNATPITMNPFFQSHTDSIGVLKRSPRYFNHWIVHNAFLFQDDSVPSKIRDKSVKGPAFFKISINSVKSDILFLAFLALAESFRSLIIFEYTKILKQSIQKDTRDNPRTPSLTRNSEMLARLTGARNQRCLHRVFLLLWGDRGEVRGETRSVLH